jgi:hypothetical protein
MARLSVTQTICSAKRLRTPEKRVLGLTQREKQASAQRRFF